MNEVTDETSEKASGGGRFATFRNVSTCATSSFSRFEPDSRRNHSLVNVARDTYCSDRQIRGKKNKNITIINVTICFFTKKIEK